MQIENPIVLLVDDLVDSAVLMRIVFERVGLVQPLQYAGDGVEAISYLRGEGVYRDRTLHPLPTIMLLDLNMPRKNGFEVLEWIREQPALKRLRICVLSASSQPEDIRRCYELGADSYLVKPGNLDGLTRMATALLSWFKLIQYSPLPDENLIAEREPARAMSSRHPYPTIGQAALHAS